VAGEYAGIAGAAQREAQVASRTCTAQVEAEAAKKNVVGVGRRSVDELMKRHRACRGGPM
jgi:hypothetical protein